MKKNSFKKSIFLSLLIIGVCIVVLSGTSYAWFTDTATTDGNKIVTGNLHVELVGADSGNPVESLRWVKAAGLGDEEIYFEPGARFESESFRVKNSGNLSLKYKLQIDGLDGDSKLLEVINFTIKDSSGSVVNLDEERNLSPGTTSDAFTIIAIMNVTAGNEYQGLTMEGIKIKAVATQDTVETDSFNNQYDKDATYPTDNVTTGE